MKKYFLLVWSAGIQGAVTKAKPRYRRYSPATKEDAMTTQIIKKDETRIDVANETSMFTIKVVMTMAALIGIWAVACLVGGLASGGIGNLIKGFVSTIVGY